MLRHLAVLAAGLSLAAAVTAADTPRPVTIRWFGHSFFQIESSQGTRIAIDPHAIPAYGLKPVPADLVLISHFHNDHDQLDTIANKEKAKVLWGLRTDERTKRPDWNPIDVKFRDVHVRTVGVYHDTVQGLERGKNAVFVIEVDGVRIVHLGDLGHVLTPDQVKKIGPVDVLMIPVGGVYALNGSEAKKVVAQLRPRQFVLPMHYGTRVYDDLLTADEFLEDQKNVKKYPGNKLTTEAGVNPPEPVIAVLNWM
jgi:L-ascorbate metabolism protein UlaG (beta-lactamase superfamily)